MTVFVQVIEVWRRNNPGFRASVDTTATLLSPSCFVLEDLIKTLTFTALCALALSAAGTATAQSGHMMLDSTWGSGWMAGYGVIWVPLLLVLLAIAVFALLSWR